MIICGTGHRPIKVGGYGTEAEEKLIDLAYRWLHERHEDVSEVISGGALGWDQALGWAAFRLGIPFTMALPFDGFDSKWPKSSQEKLLSLIKSADRAVNVCDSGYAPWKMQVRNKWMVDNSDKVLALWDGSDGGTANCVRYAESVGKPVINLWEQFSEYT